MRLISANVNGIRAAARRGGLEWLAAQQPDVLCLQEVRATDAQLADLLGDAGFADWHVAHTEAVSKGRAGVAVVSRAPQLRVQAGVGVAEFDDSGRWVEVDWVDLGRQLHGTAPGPYTWWSWRGRAFDNDAGWRIDYQLASRPLADRAVAHSVGRATAYDRRWSDHAAVTVDYDLG